MKVRLLSPDCGFDPETALPPKAGDLIADLELATLFKAMARDSEHLDAVARHAVLTAPGLPPDTIRYRQAVLTDAQAHPGLIRDLYELAGQAIANERSSAFHIFSDAPTMLVYRAVKVMRMLFDALEAIRQRAEADSGSLRSKGLKGLVRTLTDNLDADYLVTVRETLDALEFKDGLPIGVRLGPTGHGTGYGLVELDASDKGWRRHFHLFDHVSATYRVPPRDESGHRALTELEDRGLATVADILGRAVDHMLKFLTALRHELAFYVGALNLDSALAGHGCGTCLPQLVDDERTAGPQAGGLYDMALALRTGGKVVPNDVRAKDKPLIVITGANQGGKSTALRALGQAVLLMQAGLFVPAGSFRAPPCTGLFTHFARPEDAALKSGKFEEELVRMSAIADELRPGAMVLFNESFAATNEREGALVGRQIVAALEDAGIACAFVTHNYDLARSLKDEPVVDTLFLRAERGRGAARPFKLDEAPPEPTSYGADLFEKVFGEKLQPTSAGSIPSA